MADGPGDGDPWIVSLGDSYISGEAGRWAGNTGGTDEYRIDAGGDDTYYDNDGRTAEKIDRCHRSESAEAHIGGGVNSLNLACSGATTGTHWDGDRFKPGIDAYDDGNGHLGQAAQLRDFAEDHNVTTIALSIGGNDFGFADVVEHCVKDWIFSSRVSPDYCNDDSSVTSRFTGAEVAKVRAAVKQAILNVDAAMTAAGYTSSDWTLVVQNYPAPLERSTEARYGDYGTTAQSTGGCGFWRADLDYANDEIMPKINTAIWGGADDSGLSNLQRLDLTHAMDNHKLCQRGDGLAEDFGYDSQWNDDAPNNLEWVNQVRTVSTSGTNFYLQEGLHPNYWGQLALRNCLRQAYNGGSVRSGACVPSYDQGKNAQGEPNMTFGATYADAYQPPRRAFTIGGVGSKKCVDIPGGSTKWNTELALYTCGGEWNQNWTYDAADKMIRATEDASGLCLGLQDVNPGAGTKVISQVCGTGNPHEKWTLGADQQIVNDATGLCLDASGAGTSNGTKVVLWYCGSGANQKWWY